MTPAATAPARAHHVTTDYEPPRRSGIGRTMGGTRARCTCGWFSDCYAMQMDTERAIEVHLRRSQRTDFDELIKRSSIGAAIEDIKQRGIAAHLADLEHETAKWRLRRRAKHTPPKKVRTAEEAAFLRGFALATATLWRAHHDGQLVQCLLKENSLCLADFRDLDVGGDYAAIREALRSRDRHPLPEKPKKCRSANVPAGSAPSK